MRMDEIHVPRKKCIGGSVAEEGDGTSACCNQIMSIVVNAKEVQIGDKFD